MPNPGPADPPELADVGRLARRLLNRAVRTARTEDQPLRRLLLDHLGPEAATLPTVSASWASARSAIVPACRSSVPQNLVPAHPLMLTRQAGAVS